MATQELAEVLHFDLLTILNAFNTCDPNTVDLDRLREAREQINALIVSIWMRQRAYAA